MKKTFAIFGILSVVFKAPQKIFLVIFCGVIFLPFSSLAFEKTGQIGVVQVLKTSKIRGSQFSSGINGVFVSNFFSRYKTQKISGSGATGVFLAQYFSHEEKEVAQEFSEEIATLQKAKYYIDTNIRKELTNSQNRVQKLLEIEEEMIRIANISQKKQVFFNVLATELKNEYDRLQALSSTSEQEYFQNLDDLKANLAEQKFQEVVNLNQEMQKTKAQLGQAEALEQKFVIAIDGLTTKYNAIQKNRDALLAGIQVDARTARMMDLVKE